jgi:hypothetical protein
MTMTHSICFAYPCSDLADKVGKPGFVVEHGQSAVAFDSYESARDYAQVMGTTPDHMSIDNPKNSAMLHSAILASLRHIRLA